MGVILSVLWQGVVSPCTTVTILSICWIWVKLFMQEWDPRHFNTSFCDVVQRKQYWRIFLAPLSHSSLLLLLINATLLWNLRNIEQRYGPLYFFRYSLLMLLSGSIIANTLIHLVLRVIGTPTVRQTIMNLQSMGSSGLILSWLAFQSVVYATDPSPKNVMLFGMINLHPAIAPIVVLFIYYFALPTGSEIPNMGALLSGYLLAGGALQILPDAFWSACFIVDTALLVAVSVLFRESSATAPPAEEVSSGDILEVVEIGPARLVGGFSSSSDLRDILLGRRRDSPVQRGEEEEGEGEETAANRLEQGEADGEGEGEGEGMEDEAAPLLGAGSAGASQAAASAGARARGLSERVAALLGGQNAAGSSGSINERTGSLTPRRNITDWAEEGESAPV